jgi:hypothetical protein
MVVMGVSFVRLVYRHGGLWQGSIQDGRALGDPGTTAAEEVYAGRVRTAYHAMYRQIVGWLRDRGIYVILNFDQNCMQFGHQSTAGEDYCELNGIGGAWNVNSVAFAEANEALAYIVGDQINDLSAVELMVEPFPEGPTPVPPQGAANSSDPTSPNYYGTAESIRQMYVARRNVVRAVAGASQLPLIIGPNAYQSNRINDAMTPAMIAAYPNEFIVTINTFARTGGTLTTAQIIANIQDRVQDGVDYQTANNVPVYFNSWGLEDELDTPDRDILRGCLEAHLGSGCSSAMWEYEGPNFETGQGVYWLDGAVKIQRPEMYAMVKSYYLDFL